MLKDTRFRMRDSGFWSRPRPLLVVWLALTNLRLPKPWFLELYVGSNITGSVGFAVWYENEDQNEILLRGNHPVTS